jgi:hypothetical protein
MGNKICGNMTPAQEPTNIPLPKTSKPWGYDCDTEGYKVCKATPNLGDAWESFDAATPAPYYDHKTMLVYERTTHTLPTQLNNAYVVIKSTNLPKTWHIFHYAPVPATH